MNKCKVTFYPENKTVEVERDATILSAAISAGLYVNSSCGGEGVCGRCKVIVREGKVSSQSALRILPEEKLRGVHLACVSVIQSDLSVEIPAESRLNIEGLTEEEVAQRLKSDYSQAEEVELVKPVLPETGFLDSPFASKLYLELPIPTLNDTLSDLDRIERGILRAANIAVTHTALSNIKGLGELLRSSDWKVTVTLGRRENSAEIILIEPADTSKKNFGICFDIGTTTVTGQLVDLNTKMILGTKATYNKQAVFGSDVITRIMYAKEIDGLQVLHHAVVDDMNQMIQDLIREHTIDLNDVTCVVCAGNTTMIHLLLRIDPSYIRREPYVPTLNFVPVLRSSEAELRINPRGLLSCVPGVASYVGGDVTAGVLSCGMNKKEELSMLIDIGTNGEIVLGNKEFLIAAAASAGPAFEGSGVACGMRASPGAVQKVSINPIDLRVTIETINHAVPLGICGSGYIDCIAEMLRAGIIDKDGKIKSLNHKRIRNSEFGREFVVVCKGENAALNDIVITEADIENLKRAKGAIYSAASILVRHMGFDFNDVKKMYIAGGFGTYLNMENAIRLGLLPDLERSKYFFVGNSSLAGARSIILSDEAAKEAQKLARTITYFELSVEPGYMDEYMASLFFPHTDAKRFPSVR